MNTKNTHRISTDIAIVGAGPVGMALAATVARFGMKVTLIEASSGTTPFSKAVGIHAITLEKMHTLGLTDALIADGFPMRDYAVYEDGACTMSTSFRGLPTPYDFVLGLPQSKTEAQLAKDIEAQGVTVLWRHTLRSVDTIGALDDPSKPAEITVETPDGGTMVLTADYVVGADGGRSPTREAVGIGFPGGSYGKAFLLGDVKLDWNGPRYELQFHLSKHGYLLLIPMPDGMHRVIAQTDQKWEDFQDRNNRPEVTLQMVQDIIDQRGPGGIRAHSPTWLTAAPFYYRLAETAHKERVFLAGDALHLVSPLGAQGLNTGFGDAFNLGWKIGHVHSGMAHPSLLKTYGEERIALAKKLLSVTSRTTHYITAVRWYERLARRIATKWINKTIKVQQDLPALLSGIRQSYDPKVLLGASPETAWPTPGTRLPGAQIVNRTHVSDVAELVHGPRFTMMFLLRTLTDVQRRDLEAEIEKLREYRYLVRPIVVARECGANVPTLNGATLYVDPMASLVGQIGHHVAATTLVRPDGVVAASCETTDGELAHRFFQQAPWFVSQDEKEFSYVA